MAHHRVITVESESEETRYDDSIRERIFSNNRIGIAEIVDGRNNVGVHGVLLDD